VDEILRLREVRVTSREKLVRIDHRSTTLANSKLFTIRSVCVSGIGLLENLVGVRVLKPSVTPIGALEDTSPQGNQLPREAALSPDVRLIAFMTGAMPYGDLRISNVVTARLAHNQSSF
jgi:hypothetical protein